jgi:hypothetical protein
MNAKLVLPDVQVQNVQGKWVPAIPEPFPLFLGQRCSCGRFFWTREAYRGHYALTHILGLDASRFTRGA